MATVTLNVPSPGIQEVQIGGVIYPAVDGAVTVPLVHKWMLLGAGYRVIRVCLSAARPAEPLTGEHFFDSNLGKPIWWSGTAWVDAAGTEV
jgi:hypothetical protein